MARAKSTITLSRLQELAVRCGVNKSGTQGLLVRRLLNAIQDNKPLAPTTRILSIDLGIRNLAYAVLSPGAPGTKSGQQLSLPTIHAWRRLSLTSVPNPAAAGPLELESQGSDVDKVVKEEFTPLSISKIATRLVEDGFLPLKPSHILIERQRFRSGSSPAVYEWTVRVNTLEAMLYAIFSTLQSLNQWDGVLLPVDPKRVGAFMLEGREDGGEMGTKRTAAATKKQKIELLSSWLREGSTIELASDEARATSQAFLQRWRGARANKVKKEVAESAVGEGEAGSSEKLKKLDDITDSLLQGVAWLRWRENLDQLAKGDEYRLLLEMEARGRAGSGSHENDDLPT